MDGVGAISAEGEVGTFEVGAVGSICAVGAVSANGGVGMQSAQLVQWVALAKSAQSVQLVLPRQWSLRLESSVTLLCMTTVVDLTIVNKLLTAADMSNTLGTPLWPQPSPNDTIPTCMLLNNIGPPELPFEKLIVP